MSYRQTIQHHFSVHNIVETLKENTVASLFLFLVVQPVILWALDISLSYAIEILIFALGAYGVQLLFGYGGMLSFGHAAFFGSGSYAFALLYTHTELPLIGLILGSLLLVIILGLIMGSIAINQYGIYFAIITLGFAQIVYLTAFGPLKWLTGGQDGIGHAVVKPPIGIEPLTIGLNTQLRFYLFVVVVFMMWFYFLRKLLNSQLGKSFLAIRENEDRAKALGYNTTRIKLYMFMISAPMTGMAGVLWGLNLGYTGISELYWVTSGDLLIIAIVGGAYSLLGSFVGSYIFLGFRYGLGDVIGQWWPMVLGILLIAIVIRSPNGAVGKIKGLTRK